MSSLAADASQGYVNLVLEDLIQSMHSHGRKETQPKQVGPSTPNVTGLSLLRELASSFLKVLSMPPIVAPTS